MLTAKVLRCVNLRNVALGTTERQDPFVTLTLEENPKLHSKTDVCYSGGMNPQWHSGNWMRLTVPQPNMTCLVQVWDKHSQDADELIATGMIKLGEYDDDGAEDEPMAVDLYWQNSIPAGQVHLIFSYDPPVPMAYTSRQVEPAAQSTTTQVTTESTGLRPRSQFEQAQPQQEFLPWLNLQVRHKSGKVKNFLVSRSKAGLQHGYTRGRNFVENRAPAVRSSFSNQITSFKRRPMYQQSMIIAAAILLVVLPWPRALAYAFFSGLYDMFSSFGNSVYTGTSSLFQSIYNGMSAVFATLSIWGGYAASYMWRSAWYIGLYLVAPIATVLFLPRFLGWALTRLGTMVLGGPIVSFGTVTFVPWMTDFKRLKFRLILVDFLLGNPRDKGYTPRFASFNRFEFTGSLSFADMWRTITFNYQPCPLRDVPDYKRLSSLRVDHMELDGLTVNLEVNDRNKLNLVDFVSEVDRAHTNRALAMKELLSPTFRFPNCLEVQVLGARNLRSTDNNGLADPFYTVRVRKQELTSTTVVKTLNPNFPPRVEQFFLNDPSAVVSVVLQDEDIARPADFIGQWNVTAKWLLINPKKCKHVEWEILSEDERRQGWVGFWAPLVDEHFRNEGLCGDVHLRVRWVFNPSLPDIAPGDRRETQTPLQQLNTLRHEIRQRLGDLQRIFDILKHVPVLIDYQGVFVLNDTKISLHDLLYGRRHHGENVVTKIIANQREETDRRQAKLTSQYPRSLEVRETTAAVDRDRIQPVDTGVQPVRQQQQQQKPIQQQQQRPTDAIDEVIIKSADPNQPNLPRNLNVDIQTTTGMGTVSEGPSGPTTSAKITPISSSSVPPPYTATMEPVKPTSTTTTTGTSSSVTGLTSADMTGGNLTGTAPSRTTQQRSSYDESQRQHELNKQQMAPHEGPEGMTFVRKEDQVSEKDVMSREERAEFERDRDREKYDMQQRQQQQSSWLPTSLTGEPQPTTATTTDPNLTSSQVAMKERIEGHFREGDKLMAVYPEKLVTSAPGADRGYVRGELAGIQRELGSSSDVYLGYEEDDEAAEMRNEDRYNDDEREYDQDGREFIKVQPIVWRKQFLARHGDPGLNLYKFLERLIRGLIPKLASDTRLRRAVEGTAIKGIFKGEVIPGRSSATTADASGTTTTHRGGVVGAVAHKVAGGIRDAAHSVKDQAKLVEKKVMHQTQDAGLQTDPSRKEKMTTYPYEQPGTVGYVRERETPVDEPEHAKSMDAARPVHGQDADFNRSDLVISGSLEAVWQGRHRLTSMFRRYKLWHVEVKGETIFYHKMNALNANPSATDAVWYTLDLTWLQDIYLTESHRAHNNELILQFVQDDHTLHFRLPSKVTTPTLPEWLAAFRQVQRAQQDRRRLGSMAGTPDVYRTSPTSPKDVRYQQQQQRTTGTQQTSFDEQQTTTWPGEDLQPQQRARGSSLLAPQVNVSSNQPVTASATTTTTGTGGMVPMAGVMTAAPPMPPSTTEMAAATSTSTAPTTVSQTPSTTMGTTTQTPSTSTTSQTPTMGKPQEVTVELKKEPQIKELGNFDATTTDPTLTRQVAQS